MPELPEVETTRRGLQPHLEGKRIKTAVVRSRALRQPVPRNLPQLVAETTVRRVGRRGKYLLIDCGRGTLIVHLGMSGRLWLTDAATRPERHDHFDLVMASGAVVRLRDPRRFGLVLWDAGDVLSHPLLKDIGPEPLGAEFDGAWLYRETRNRSVAIKQALMDSHLVAGVGNIYANEALFRAGATYAQRNLLFHNLTGRRFAASTFFSRGSRRRLSGWFVTLATTGGVKAACSSEAASARTNTISPA